MFYKFVLLTVTIFGKYGIYTSDNDTLTKSWTITDLLLFLGMSSSSVPYICVFSVFTFPSFMLTFSCPSPFTFIFHSHVFFLLPVHVLIGPFALPLPSRPSLYQTCAVCHWIPVAEREKKVKWRFVMCTCKKFVL